MKKILFRADSSSTIGTGHIMRDLVLAEKYAMKGSEIIFAVRDLEGNINHKILEAGYKLKNLQSNSKKELSDLVKKLHIDLLIIDHYKINYQKEKYIKKETGVSILSFDDTYKAHYCDILLNHNVGAKKKKYKNLIPKHAKIKCGIKYTLLRKEFYYEKKKVYKKCKNIKNVLVAMGGADTANLNIDILNTLQEYNNIKVTLISTSANKNLKQLKLYTDTKEWVHLYIDSNKVAKLMKQSDIAIITPSVILNEIYFMKVPFIAIQTASNQKDILKFIKRKGLPYLKKFKSKKFKEILCKIL